jgi:isopenicillin-N N-acyltransferase-like protein
VEVDSLCDDQLAALEKRWPTVLAELRGMGEASGASLRDLIVINAYTDLKDFVDDRTPLEGGCSAVAVKGPHANFTAQTWDMHASAAPFTLLLQIPGAVRPAWILTIMGCVGLCGVNAAGVSVMINNLQCGETYRSGLIWTGLVRLMLEQSSAADAYATLRDNLPGSGHNYIIADAKQAMNVETTGRRTTLLDKVERSKPGYVLHTNHYLSDLAEYEVKSRLGPTTQRRLAALKAFASANPAESVTSADVSEQFFASGSLCDCLKIDPGDNPHGGATCGGLGVEHDTGKVLAFGGQYSVATRREWKIK